MADPKKAGDPTTRTDSLRPKPRLGTRVSRVMLLLFLMLLAAHFLWGTAAQRKLARTVEAYRAQGEPMLPADFAQPPVPDEENAVVDLRAAAASIDLNSPRSKAFDELNFDLPLAAKDWAVVQDFLDANGTALEKADAASAKAGVDWRLKLQTPVVMLMLPDLKQQRHLAKVLSADALVAHRAGDDARAVRRLRQVLFIGRAVDRQPTLVSHLVSIGIGALASDRAEKIAPTLTVAPAPSGDGAGPATPEQVKGLMADLLAYDADNAGAVLAMRGERMMQLDTVTAILDGKISSGQLVGTSGNGSSSAPGSEAAAAVARYAVKPLLMGDARLMLRYMTELVAVANAPDWQAWKARQPTFPREVKDKRYLHPFAAILLPALDRAMLQQYRGLTDRRLSATALAVRLYVIRHDGRLPANLSDLVPNELASLPKDPMSAGRPLSYADGTDSRSHAGDPVLYSIGEDGVDDGGSDDARTDQRRRSAVYRWDRKDAVLHLKPPAPKADSDAGDGQTQQGQQSEPTAPSPTAPSPSSR